MVTALPLVMLRPKSSPCVITLKPLMMTKPTFIPHEMYRYPNSCDHDFDSLKLMTDTVLMHSDGVKWLHLVFQFGICENHGEVLEFWCRDCQAPLCGSCPVKKDHDVVRTRLLLQEKKMEIQEQGNLILQSVVDEKKKIIQKVKKCSLQLLRTCEESSLTTNSAEDVKVMMGDTKKTADVSSVLGYLARMKTILGSFKSAPEDTDAEGKASANRHRRTRNSQKQQGQDSTNSSPNNTLRRRTNAAGDSTTGTPRTRTRSSLRQETKSTDKITYTTTNDHNTNNNNNNKGLETALLEPSLWPLKCCAYAEDGRKGELKWEDKRLHLYALGNHMEDAHFMIKAGVAFLIIRLCLYTPLSLLPLPFYLYLYLLLLLLLFS